MVLKGGRLINAKTGQPLAFEILANSNAQEALAAELRAQVSSPSASRCACASSTARNIRSGSRASTTT